MGRPEAGGQFVASLAPSEKSRASDVVHLWTPLLNMHREEACNETHLYTPITSLFSNSDWPFPTLKTTLPLYPLNITGTLPPGGWI